MEKEKYNKFNIRAFTNCGLNIHMHDAYNLQLMKGSSEKLKKNQRKSVNKERGIKNTKGAQQSQMKSR